MWRKVQKIIYRPPCVYHKNFNKLTYESTGFQVEVLMVGPAFFYFEVIKYVNNIF